MLDFILSLNEANVETIVCIYLYKELEESEAWIREKSAILGAQGFGKDLTSVLKLLQKHKTLAGELLAHRSLLQVREFLGISCGFGVFYFTKFYYS